MGCPWVGLNLLFEVIYFVILYQKFIKELSMLLVCDYISN